MTEIEPIPASRRRPGRPKRGIRDARDGILAAALAAFVEGGYAATSIRGIALAAQVDPGTVRHHFGAKHRLLAAALGLRIAPSDVLERALQSAPPDRLPERLLALVIRSWEDTEATEPLRSLVALALADPQRRALFVEYIESEVVGRLAASLNGSHRRERAAAALEVVTGLIFSRYILRLPTFAAAPPGDVYRRTIGPLRVALTGAVSRA